MPIKIVYDKSIPTIKDQDVEASVACFLEKADILAKQESLGIELTFRTSNPKLWNLLIDKFSDTQHLQENTTWWHNEYKLDFCCQSQQNQNQSTTYTDLSTGTV
ncbi:hypothetical protein PCC6912_39400 [Chlorogloeopsis fritschii PCC 6912]|uniref:Uncharacterized protein n=1 Tax=Chlorogloeopsis fritschii PCC 6912 TaxID=211165 RepID=A0A3S0XNT1_CHLFR|nr:hypothetical protein [Chlorogloeopsis fritschii]RUR76981.1 hypothetical protein PCC6912_39400 [Chlorogloeopsis fritschii PCC 6912]